MSFEDVLESTFESLTFKPPSNLVQIRGFYEIYKSSDIRFTFSEILRHLGLSYKKIESFKAKMNKGFTPKELTEVQMYLKCNTSEIQAVLYTFTIQGQISLCKL
jgi:hypothetical protein